MKNKIDKIFSDVARKHQLEHLLEKSEPDLHKSDFVRRGLLLAALGGGLQHVTNEMQQQKQPISRQVADVDMEKPKTEPEKAYDHAQKDAFTIAAKHLPLSRNLARKTIKESPDLSRSHGYLLHLSPSAFKEVVQNNPEIKRDVANYHYPKLYELHQGDQNKIFDEYKKKATNAKTDTYEK